MVYKNDIFTKSRNGIYKFKISEKNDELIIYYQRLPAKYKGQEMPDEDMLISQIHIANIPAVVEAIFKVFQMKEGGSVDIKEHGDKLSIDMLCNDHGQFSDLIVLDVTRRIRNGLPNQMEFVFEEYMSINTPPLPRTPTPAMIWVTDTLKKIHEEWEERKKGEKE